MQINAKFVNIIPPLQVKADPLAQAYLVGIGPEQLHIRTASAQNSPKSDHSIILIPVFERQPFKIGGQFGGPAGEQTDHILTVANSDLSKTNELLTLLRKNQHIRICASEDVEHADKFTGFERFSFVPKTLPELNFGEIDTAQTFLGKTFAAPFLISGMTGGIEKGALINRRLAQAAVKMGMPMGIGSQRLALEHAEYAHIFQVKNHSDTKDLFLIANIGAAQLYQQLGRDECLRAVDMIDANALAIHVNVLQELVQPEGDRLFAGLLKKIADLAKDFPVPIIIKEVGHGMDLETAQRLLECGVEAIDVGGRGGTSWAHIEGMRSADPLRQELARNFRNFGVPTAFSVKMISKHVVNAAAGTEKMQLVATGGMRDGIMAAKAIALGATMVGLGLPLLRAALEDDEAPVRVLERLVLELKTCMLCAGVRTLDGLERRLTLGEPYEREVMALMREQELPVR